MLEHHRQCDVVHTHDPDVTIIGAGFGGIAALYHLRKLGLNCRILEKGKDLGGVWHWTNYPGARTDSSVPSYGFGMPECRQGWDWSCNYPDSAELRRYFAHCDKKLDIKKHVTFETQVSEAHFHQASNRWSIRCTNGQIVRSKYLVVAIGCTHEPVTFSHHHLGQSKGQVYEPALWPAEGVDPEGKDVAVIGTGCTGVQIVQAWAGKVKSLTLFQRTPNFAIPMDFKRFSEQEKKQIKDNLPATFEYRRTVPTGLAVPSAIDHSALDESLEERESTLEDLYQRGGFPFWISSYKDIMRNHPTNWLVYQFWARKTRPRIDDLKKRNILAPLQPPHPFGAKRPALETNYFEQFNRGNVDVVDVNVNPISAFTESEIITSDGMVFHEDIIVSATGFTAPAKQLSSLGLRGIDGVKLEDIWAERVQTYLGMMCHGFPNMFIIDGPQAPSEVSNVPSTVEVQAEWVSDMVKKMESGGIQSVHPTLGAAQKWAEKVDDVSKDTLYATTESRFTATSGPGPRLQGSLFWRRPARLY